MKRTMKFVAYYRVSTARQGASGLGLDAQRSAVERYVESVGGQLLATFAEVASGAKSDRPALAKAMERCKLTGAKLLIAKLDRLSRNVAFLANLMETGVPFGGKHQVPLRCHAGLNLGVRCAHPGEQLLRHLFVLVDKFVPRGIDLRALMQDDTGDEGAGAAEAKGKPSGNKAGDESNARASTRGDPGWPLPPHVNDHCP